MERRGPCWRVIAVAGVVFVSACSGSEAGVPVSDPVADVVAPADDGELFTERQGITAVDDDGQPVEPVTESLPPVAETGVPGIGSEDAFCRSWSTYAGSVSAIFLTWGLQPAPDAARLEVAASSAVSGAVDSMSDAYPPEIEPNRDVLILEVAGPVLRRSQRAVELLQDAGLSASQIDELGERWVAAITEQGIESETLSIDVPPASAEALESAALAFASELPPTFEDPTLDTTGFDISPTVDYAAANCPDQGTLAGNDVIDSGGS